MQYSCVSTGTLYTYVYDFKNNPWYRNKNYMKRKKFYFKDYNDKINNEQEIFNQEFKEIHEEIKKKLKNYILK